MATYATTIGNPVPGMLYGLPADRQIDTLVVPSGKSFDWGDPVFMDAGDADKAKYSIRVQAMKPAQIALLIIRNNAHNKLVYGENHVYRGVLSMAGNDYLAQFIKANSESVKLNLISSDEADDDLTELKIAISELG